MEVVEGGRNGCRDHHEAQTRMMSRPVFKKVQVVYYLSRNGHLEHPHYMEVTHLAHHHLRLKDVMERLRRLRGKAMPSLYSWSCKRNYKNGYVWNDLSENDEIYPSEGAEYVLKGSELIHGCTENGNSQQISGQESSLQPRIKGLGLRQYGEDQEFGKNRRNGDSIGVSELSLDSSNSFSSPPSTTSSDTIINNNGISKRFEDGDPVGTEPLLSRNSMLLSLIACGGSASFRKTVPPPNGGGSIHKAAATEDDEMIIGCMSENPRFGDPQGEEKEYFSGSIVETLSSERGDSQPGLKKSSSHNEERSNASGLGEAGDEETERDNGLKGKCIPRKKASSKQSRK